MTRYHPGLHQTNEQNPQYSLSKSMRFDGHNEDKVRRLMKDM